MKIKIRKEKKNYLKSHKNRITKPFANKSSTPHFNKRRIFNRTGIGLEKVFQNNRRTIRNRILQEDKLKPMTASSGYKISHWLVAEATEVHRTISVVLQWLIRRYFHLLNFSV